MKTIFIECSMGVAGDMLCGALLDTLTKIEQQKIINTLNNLIDGVSVEVKPDTKCNICGTKFSVNVKNSPDYHHHSSIEEIFKTIDSFDIPAKVIENSKKVYDLIAKAESKVHGTDVAEIHLHEVGTKDAIIDIVGFCLLMDYMKIKKVVCSEITTGYGEVMTAHGILPIPAPATAELLCGINNTSGNIEGELATPTGVALVKYFADEFSQINTITHEVVGYGMGSKDFEKANCVRIFLGESNERTVFELRCQIDDMTGEEMGYAINKLLSLGARDAFVTPIVMKKSRPAYLLTVISAPEKKDYLTDQIFKHTTTLGIRQVECARKELDREIKEKNSVHIKRTESKEKIEFDDLAKFADKNDISLFEARKIINEQ